MTKAHFENFIESRETQLGNVLEYHLNIEGLLVVMIESNVKNPGVLNLERMTFARKLALARALDLLTEKQFRILVRMNRLRNKYAHRLGYQASYAELLDLVRDAGKAGIGFSDSVASTDIRGAQDLGYGKYELINALFRNAFYWIASNQDEDIWLDLTA